jgi:hypothetical protein
MAQTREDVVQLIRLTPDLDARLKRWMPTLEFTVSRPQAIKRLIEIGLCVVEREPAKRRRRQ